MGHEDRGIVGPAQLVHRVRHGLERVDVEPGVRLVEDGQLRIEHGELQDLVALLLAPGEALVHGPAQVAVVPPDGLELLGERVHELDGPELLFAPVLADRVHRGAQEVGVGDAADGDRVLKRQEDPLPGPGLRGHGQEVLPLVQHGARGHGVGGVSREHLSERALARAVGAHDRVHFADVHREVHAAQDLAALHRRVQVLDLQQHQPTLPSRLMPSNRCASTANSIGNSLKTSLQNPLTIMDTASSADRPRCLA